MSRTEHDTKQNADTIALPIFHLPFLDGLRGLAVLMVVGVHSSQVIGNVSENSFHFGSLERWVNAGARGVQLFFVLSAFTLFLSLDNRIKQRNEPLPIRAFYIRRFFRIIPIWWTAVLLLAWKSNSSLEQIILSLTFLFGFNRFQHATDIVPGGWSLFVEETFYLFMPILFKYISSPLRACFLTMTLFATSKVWLHSAPLLGVPNDNSYVYLFPLSQWHCFGIGIFLYLFWRDGHNSKRVFTERSIFLDLFALTALLMTIDSGIHWATAGFFLVFLRALNAESVWRKCFENALLMRFGRCCFSIYLFHLPLLEFLSPYKSILFTCLSLEKLPVDIRFIIFFPAFSLACLCLGEFSFRFFELQTIKLGRSFLQNLNSKKTKKA